MNKPNLAMHMHRRYLVVRGFMRGLDNSLQGEGLEESITIKKGKKNLIFLKKNQEKG